MSFQNHGFNLATKMPTFLTTLVHDNTYIVHLGYGMSALVCTLY